jgi:hypothetical protein
MSSRLALPDQQATLRRAPYRRVQFVQAGSQTQVESAIGSMRDAWALVRAPVSDTHVREPDSHNRPIAVIRLPPSGRLLPHLRGRRVALSPWRRRSGPPVLERIAMPRKDSPGRRRVAQPHGDKALAALWAPDGGAHDRLSENTRRQPAARPSERGAGRRLPGAGRSRAWRRGRAAPAASGWRGPVLPTRSTGDWLAARDGCGPKRSVCADGLNAAVHVHATPLEEEQPWR